MTYKGNLTIDDTHKNDVTLISVNGPFIYIAWDMIYILLLWYM